MKTIFVTGDDYRHLFMIYKFSKYFNNFAWVIEKRSINLNHITLKKKSKIYKNHIEDFNREQRKFFYKTGMSFFNLNKKKIQFLDRKKISSKEFNEKIYNLVKKFKPNILVSYGCQKINVRKIKRIKKLKIKFFNIHGGLLPKYRGVNTNFWPHYKNNCNYIGLTLHSLNQKIDSGNVFFQSSVKITKKDTVNSLSCKAIKNFANKTPDKLSILLKKKFSSKGIRIKIKKKLFLKKDFEPKFIKIAYRNLREYLKRNEKIKQPKLINIF